MNKTFLAILSVSLSFAVSAARDPDRVTEGEIRAALAATPATHPRLFATADDFAAVRRRMEEDGLLRDLVAKVKRNADDACAAKPLEHRLEGFRLLHVARECLMRVLNAALAYRLSGETKYRDEVRREMETVLAFPDWNPKHFLDTAEFSLAVAIGYDWLYAAWDPAFRRTVEEGLVRLGIEPSFGRKMWWVTGNNNWTSVCHAGLIAAAVAIKDVEHDRAVRVLHRAVTNLKRPAAELSPNGNYPEGPSYWSYGVGFHVLAIDLLEGNLGTAFGLDDVPGWKETADYPDWMTGPSGKTFNYSDGGMGRAVDAASWWFARRYGRPEILTSYELPLLRRALAPKTRTDRLFPLTVLWYRPVPDETPSRARKGWESLGRAPMAVRRTGWGTNGVYVAVKGGTPSVNHGHMDAGSFVLDAHGVRWAYDLGAEPYHGIEKRGLNLWNNAQDSDRWKVFRLNAFAHNTLMLDGAQQRVKGFAPVAAAPDGTVTVDLTPVCTNATRVTRTMRLADDGSQCLLMDRVEGLRPGAPIRWAMMTRAKAVREGRRLALAEAGRRVTLEPVGVDADWQVTEDVRMNEWDSPNTGYRQVTFTLPMPAAGAAAFGVRFRFAPDPFAEGTVHHGFKVTSVRELPEVDGRLVRMEYLKNGAELAWLDRADDNKTFSIGFRTLPADDTGVAHILEHSVLCGSERYPVKEPFVDLLKGSFATFLNAFTSADATMYPVCSRNETDFHNLIDVYLDAVFHPLCVKTPLAFRQEGWHWQLDRADGELTRNGVVYSEMKGAFSNPERTLYAATCRLLYPDTCYGHVSGGDPAAIPDLTFAGYRAFYDRFYHPSNARIFLDGTLDVEALLAKLDATLSPYARRAVEPVRFQAPVSGEKTLPYEIGAHENPEGKVLLSEGWVFGRYDDRETYLALDVLTDALAGDNEAPLKKALLERNLCEDVSFGVGSHAHLQAMLTLKNVKAGNVAAARAVVRDTLAACAAKGLDHARLAALLDRAEFHDREKDYGGFPRGLAFYMDAVDFWQYGGDPAEAFRNAARFAALRRELASGGFERILKRTLVDNPHHVRVTLVPDPGLAAKRAAEEKAACARVKAAWGAEETARVVAECRELTAHQNAPDRPEDAAKLPRLAVRDVPVEGPVTAREIVKEQGVTVIRPRTAAKGVIHLRAYFSAADLSAAECADLPVLARVLGDLATRRHGIDVLRNALDGRLGSFHTGTGVYAAPGETRTAHPYFEVHVSALETHGEDVLTWVPETLLETSFADTTALARLLRPYRVSLERAATGIGARNFAFRRAAAQLSARGALEETFNGFELLRHVQAIDAAGDAGVRALAGRLAALARKTFVRERLTLCLADNVPAAFAGRFAAVFPSDPAAAEAPARVVEPLPRAREGFRITGGIASAARVAHPAESVYSGTAVVAARILTLDYLWDEIRVKGGAYGGNFRVRADGDAGWLSWNDPQPARSLGVYGGCGAALRRFVDSDASLDRYVVSAVAATEPYLTPSVETTGAAALYLSGRTPADLQRLRGEMLRTTKADLRAFAAEAERLAQAAAICVVAGPAPLAACSNLVDRVEAVTR